MDHHFYGKSTKQMFCSKCQALEDFLNKILKVSSLEVMSNSKVGVTALIDTSNANGSLALKWRWSRVTWSDIVVQWEPLGPGDRSCAGSEAMGVGVSESTREISSMPCRTLYRIYCCKSFPGFWWQWGIVRTQIVSEPRGSSTAWRHVGLLKGASVSTPHPHPSFLGGYRVNFFGVTAQVCTPVVLSSQAPRRLPHKSFHSLAILEIPQQFVRNAHPRAYSQRLTQQVLVGTRNLHTNHCPQGVLTWTRFVVRLWVTVSQSGCQHFMIPSPAPILKTYFWWNVSHIKILNSSHGTSPSLLEIILLRNLIRKGKEEAFPV